MFITLSELTASELYYSKIVKLLSHRETHFWSVFTGRGLNKKQLIYRILVELKENLLTK